ncbi:hypothetical protein OXX80_014303, partial [Metschnikowia pulcherrima]
PKIVDGLYYADITTEITPDETCEYDFSLTVCGTAQLFVDGELLIDNKTHQTSGNSFFGAGTIEVIQSKALKAGQTYKVSVQFGCAKTATIKKRLGVDVRGSHFRGISQGD